jgi:hypothetical protein
LNYSSYALEGEYNIRPIPKPFTTGNNYDKVTDKVFQKDPRFYSANRNYPGKILETIDTWDLAGQNSVTLRFYPVQYNAVTKEVFVVEDVSFRVSWDEMSEPVTSACNFTERGKAIYEEMLTNMVINPDYVNIPEYEGNPGLKDLPAGKYEHVIITTEAFKSSWTNLTAWHSKKGVPDTVVTTTWIYANYTGDNQKRIRDFVKDANVQWGTLWVLLGGDTGQIPYKNQYYLSCTIPTDSYYSDYDDDWTNEVFIGRASVDNTTELSAYINKVLSYEKTPSMTNFGATAEFMGFDFDYSTHTENMMKDIASSLLPSYFSVKTVYDTQTTNHRTECLNGLNNGPNLINHADHSSYDLVGAGYVNHNLFLYISDMLSLHNGTKYGNFYSVGCHSNEYDQNDCFGESFVKSTGGGGTSYIGNSNYGWYNPGYTNTLSCFYDKEFYKSLCTNKYTQVGKTLADSKNRNRPTDDYLKFIWVELTLIGEPEMPLWMNNPKTMTATYPAQIQTGSQTFTVNVKYNGTAVQNALVCIRKLSDHIYQYGLTNASGDKSFTISPTAGNMEVTISGQDLLPHEGTVIVSGENPLTITLKPDNTVIKKPGVLGFQADIVNSSSSSQHYQGWTEVTLPNGKPYSGNPVIGPTWFTVPAYGTISEHFEHNIGTNAPLGIYKYTAKIGFYPGNVLDEDSFNFEVQ